MGVDRQVICLDGPLKGLSAESARAVTGRLHWGRLFGASAVCFFTIRAVTRKQKVEKLIHRCQIAEGYKQAIDEIQNFGPKKNSLPDPSMF